MFISTANLYADQIVLALAGKAAKVIVDVWQDEEICSIGLRFTYKDPRPQKPIDNFNDVITFDVVRDVDITGSPAADAILFSARADELFAQWVAEHA